MKISKSILLLFTVLVLAHCNVENDRCCCGPAGISCGPCTPGMPPGAYGCCCAFSLAKEKLSLLEEKKPHPEDSTPHQNNASEIEKFLSSNIHTQMSKFEGKCEILCKINLDYCKLKNPHLNCDEINKNCPVNCMKDFVSLMVQNNSDERANNQVSPVKNNFNLKSKEWGCRDGCAPCPWGQCCGIGCTCYSIFGVHYCDCPC